MIQHFTSDRLARFASHDDVTANSVDAEWDAAAWRRKTRFLLAGMIAVLVVTGIVAYSAGWLSANYVPTSKSLRDPNNPARAFIISEEKIWGIYGNLDVDSIVFQYKSGETDAEEFWDQVDNRAA